VTFATEGDPAVDRFSRETSEAVARSWRLWHRGSWAASVWVWPTMLRWRRPRARRSPPDAA